MLSDKDVSGFLDELSDVFDEVIVTENSSPRALATEKLFPIAVDIFGEERVSSAGSTMRAIELAIDRTSHPTQSIGIVITGSVVTAGTARSLLKKGGQL